MWWAELPGVESGQTLCGFGRVCSGRAGAAGDVCESGGEDAQMRCWSAQFWTVGVALFAARFGRKTGYWENSRRLLAGIVLVDLLAVQHVAPEVAAVFSGCFFWLAAALGADIKKPGTVPVPVVAHVRLRVEGSTLKVSSATRTYAALQASFIFSYCFQVDGGSGFRPSPSASFRAMPLSLAA